MVEPLEDPQDRAGAPDGGRGQRPGEGARVGAFFDDGYGMLRFVLLEARLGKAFVCVGLVPVEVGQRKVHVVRLWLFWCRMFKFNVVFVCFRQCEQRFKRFVACARWFGCG